LKVVKRVVGWPAWEKQTGEEDRPSLQNQYKQSVRNPPLDPSWNWENGQSFNPRSSQVGKINSNWASINDPDHSDGHSYEFHQQNPSIPIVNSKWNIPNGRNEFNGQSAPEKEEDEWYEGVSSESKVGVIFF
jgi:hypothetical protein